MSGRRLVLEVAANAKVQPTLVFWWKLGQMPPSSRSDHISPRIHCSLFQIYIASLWLAYPV